MKSTVQILRFLAVMALIGALTSSAQGASILSFTQPVFSAVEGANVSITITRLGGTTGTVSCTYWTQNGTGIAGTDYVGVSGAMFFVPGEVTKSFTVALLNNSIADGERTVTLRITNISTGTAGPLDLAILRIIDDDSGQRIARFDVPAQANIFGAGHASAPGPAGSGGGIVPPAFEFVGPGVFTFGATGTVSYDGATYFGPDGTDFGASTDMASLGGISGIMQGSRTMFLVGVFLGDQEPSGEAPPRLDFSNVGFSDVSPLLNQTFFIGDGLTGTGAGNLQRFYAPAGARRLCLGFADGLNFNGLPGAYGDNAGALQVNLTLTPAFTLISTGSVWKFLDNGSDQGTNWQKAGFDDSAWRSGPAQFGYGDGDEATVLGFGNEPTNRFVTTYFRHSFTLYDTSRIESLIVRLLRDDGAVVYLNGVEFWRCGMPANQAISYSTWASDVITGADESIYLSLPGSSSLLVSGLNVVAVEIHQANATSSDVSFDLELGAVKNPAPLPLILVNGRFDPFGSHTVTNTAEIRLESAFPNATMFYSLDGSMPSSLYGGPFRVGRSVSIRALAYNSNFVQSAQSGPVSVTVLTGYSLLATTAGGGSLAVNNANALFLSNAVVNVTAIPSSGWTFLGWLGDASGADPAISVTMNRNKCVQAVFGTSVATSVVGSGSILVNPASTFYPYGTQVRLTAVPQTGNYFALWGNAAAGTNNPLAFAVVTPTPTITSVFASLAAGRVALTVNPDGNGTVIMNPQASFYTVSQIATLTAVPTPGQAFLGWSGSVTGTQNPLTVTINQSKVITASFSDRPRLNVTRCFGQPAGEGVQLTLASHLGAAYRFDASTDLKNWTPLGTLTNFLGTIQFNQPFVPNITHRFYRAAPAEP